MRRVLKFATGEPIPDGAEYVSTVTQHHTIGHNGTAIPSWFVWHYFIVIEKEEFE